MRCHLARAAPSWTAVLTPFCNVRERTKICPGAQGRRKPAPPAAALPSARGGLRPARGPRAPRPACPGSGGFPAYAAPAPSCRSGGDPRRLNLPQPPRREPRSGGSEGQRSGPPRLPSAPARPFTATSAWPAGSRHPRREQPTLGAAARGPGPGPARRGASRGTGAGPGLPGGGSTCAASRARAGAPYGPIGAAGSRRKLNRFASACPPRSLPWQRGAAASGRAGAMVSGRGERSGAGPGRPGGTASLLSPAGVRAAGRGAAGGGGGAWRAEAGRQAAGRAGARVAAGGGCAAGKSSWPGAPRASACVCERSPACPSALSWAGAPPAVPAKSFSFKSCSPTP